MLDGIILIFLVIGAIRGYFTGFVIQSLTLVALILGIWAAIKFNPFLTELILKYVTIKGNIAPYISFTVIFIAIIILVHYIGVLATKFIDKTAVSFLNRSGGILFGIFKFACILSICFLLINKFDKTNKIISLSVKEKSMLYTPVSQLVPSIFPHIDFERVKRGILGT
jgi:membrane protein required for colicin V production